MQIWSKWAPFSTFHLPETVCVPLGPTAHLWPSDLALSSRACPAPLLPSSCNPIWRHQSTSKCLVANQIETYRRCQVMANGSTWVLMVIKLAISLARPSTQTDRQTHSPMVKVPSERRHSRGLVIISLRFPLSLLTSRFNTVAARKHAFKTGLFFQSSSSCAKLAPNRPNLSSIQAQFRAQFEPNFELARPQLAAPKLRLGCPFEEQHWPDFIISSDARLLCVSRDQCAPVAPNANGLGALL